MVGRDEGDPLFPKKSVGDGVGRGWGQAGRRSSCRQATARLRVRQGWRTERKLKVLFLSLCLVWQLRDPGRERYFRAGESQRTRGIRRKGPQSCQEELRGTMVNTVEVGRE